MDWKVFATVFGAVFLAELGDKTQLAIVSFVGSGMGRFTVLAAAALALVASTALAVAVGVALLRVIPGDWLRLAAAILFIAVGIAVGVEAVGEIRA
ncbi:MAG: TMEM165/GDT1 family protein [Actinobacteria bacterium]|nr:TMEM165/GDT1 family protein [Actinomycetota bacterium]